MECVAPPELDAMQLLMALDHEVDETISRHLAQCEYCQNRADALALMEQKLGQNLYRVDCPPAATLGQYSLKKLPRDQHQIIQGHLATCPHCQRDLAAIQEWQQEIATEDEAESPGPISRYIATLFEGGLIPSAATPGLRGDQPSMSTDSLTQIYDAEPARITLEIAPLPEGSDQKVLYGTIVGAELPDLEVYLWRGTQFIGAGQVDADRGTFEFPGLTAGMYELSIIGADYEIQITEVSV